MLLAIELFLVSNASAIQSPGATTQSFQIILKRYVVRYVPSFFRTHLCEDIINNICYFLLAEKENACFSTSLNPFFPNWLKHGPCFQFCFLYI